MKRLITIHDGARWQLMFRFFTAGNSHENRFSPPTFAGFLSHYFKRLLQGDQLERRQIMTNSKRFQTKIYRSSAF